MKNKKSSDPYYDLLDDYDLIVSSFQSQYGIRLAKEISDMTWKEFKAMLIGIAPDTALGRIVSIRSENNKNKLKNFTKEEHHIRNEWRNRKAKKMTQEECDNALEAIKNALINLAK